MPEPGNYATSAINKRLLLRSYSLDVDRNEDDEDASVDLQARIFYGEVLDVIALHIDPSEEYELEEELFVILAHIHPCPTEYKDATLEPVTYTEAAFNAQTPYMIKVTTIVGSVGRVFANGRWGIVDRWNEMAAPVFEFDEGGNIHEV